MTETSPDERRILNQIDNTRRDSKTNSSRSGGGSGSTSNVFKAPKITINSKGELTSYINVYRTKTGYIHGCPENP